MASTIMNVVRERHPKAKLPNDRRKKVWRYMDFWKFEDLVRRRAMFLCRVDKLQDHFEGRVSSTQILEMNDELQRRGLKCIAESEKHHRQRHRRQFFISSWCMNDHDLDLMWKAYTTDNNGVAIQSTIDRLERVADQVMEYWPVDVSMVRYTHFAEGEYIDYADGFDAIVHKDVYFELDREVRLVHRSNMKEPFPGNILLPVQLDTLIAKIVLHPTFELRLMKVLSQLLHEAGLGDVIVRNSRNHRPVEE